LLLVAGLAARLRRVAGGRGGEQPLHAIATTLGLVLVLAAILERWPSRREGPALEASRSLSDGRTIFLDGPVRKNGEVYELSPGETTLLVRAPQAPAAAAPSPDTPTLALLVGGTGGTVELPGRAPLALRPQGLVLNVPLEAAVIVSGSDGAREALFRQVLRVAGPPMALRFPGAIASAPEPSPEKVEPLPSGER
jgi:hypothetical protein